MDPINDKNAQPASTAVYTDLRADILSGVIADGSTCKLIRDGQPFYSIT